MKEAIGMIVFVVAIILGMTWVFQGNEFFMLKVFAPKMEQVRRETFEQSKAYNQGMIQDLESMQMEYIQAAPDQKDALATIILHRMADFDRSKLPESSREFLEKLERGER